MASVIGQVHPSGDEALGFLANVPGTIGDFVRVYPGVKIADQTKWLEPWFQERINKHFNNKISDSDLIIPPDKPALEKHPSSITKDIRLSSIQPHYFRGFRDTQYPIPLNGDLVVIDGRNTSGKTSLAEALEWLFSGCLSRRENMDLGSPHELENCISNQFCPSDDITWVNATFASTTNDKAEKFVLRRILKEDYGDKTTLKCKSILLFNDRELTDHEERETLETLFASVPPILMQHTLRLFVESPPNERRQYFERLLHLDELTSLITKAVVGDARLSEFPSPTGGLALKSWNSLGTLLRNEISKKAFKQASRPTKDDLSTKISNSLVIIANNEFAILVGTVDKPEDIRTILTKEQNKTRVKSFPILSQLRPKRQILDDFQCSYAEEITELGVGFVETWKTYIAAKDAAYAIGKARVAVAKALSLLKDEKVIQEGVSPQICPLCGYEELKTLTNGRIIEIEGWTPIQQAEFQANENLKIATNSLMNVMRKALQDHMELLPVLPLAADFDLALRDAGEDLQKAVQELRNKRAEDDAKLKESISSVQSLLLTGITIPSSAEECKASIEGLTNIATILKGIASSAHRYRDSLRAVEAAVGAVASVDPDYRLRESLLMCFVNIAGIAADFRWEQAKQQAKSDLENIRQKLMEYRNAYLESKRITFNEGIGEVWGTLRADEYSSFSKLHVPPPEGKGFPVEIEVKAMLNDGHEQKEVDALRVFSESQVNALGIAAFITRSKLLGHKTLIFDDPVQSMDEEHFKTFAKDVLTPVLNEGFQVIILTHNDMFARDISHCHYDRHGYVTMTVRLSLRHGCVVDEGNRRFSERLKLAEKKIDDGHLPEAWMCIRLALERLYTIVYVKHGPPNFNPNSWQDQTAEYMWDNGAGNLIEAKMPGAGKDLKDILDMTVAGAHDKAARGETDLRHSIKFLRSLPSVLNVGG